MLGGVASVPNTVITTIQTDVVAPSVSRVQRIARVVSSADTIRTVLLLINVNVNVQAILRRSPPAVPVHTLEAIQALHFISTTIVSELQAIWQLLPALAAVAVIAAEAFANIFVVAIVH